MAHGENDSLQEHYLDNVKDDFNELKKHYPFSDYVIAPTREPSPVVIKCIAANKKFIDEMNAREDDFLGEYDKKLEIAVPFNYKTCGCEVYGGRWLDDSISQSDQHFYSHIKRNGLYKLCVGVPESFSTMNNVILECVKTADNMLAAYEELQSGRTNILNLKSYSHGDKGRKEYKSDRKKYQS